MGKLSDGEAASRMGTVPEWNKNAAEISRTFTFKDFEGSMRFVNAVAGEAEKANHHPDIDIRWNKVKLALSTHSEGGLTENDFNLAKTIDQLAKSHARS